MTTTYCGGCGRPGDGTHPRCERLLAYDPPRYCTACGFRLDVQVFPSGVRSSCRRCSKGADDAPQESLGLSG